jgi:hypothetical protein
MKRNAWGVAVSLFLLASPASAAAQEVINCPSAPANPPIRLQPMISSQMYSDVCFFDVFPGSSLPILLFDDYAWRSFLALTWPAKQGQRGRPDSSAPLGAKGRPTVFETFKAEWEVFQQDGADPKAWNDYGGTIPCTPSSLVFGDIVLAAFSKFDNITLADKPSGALIAQNGTYARYSSGFNETHFQHVVDGKFYLRKNLPNFKKPFPSGAIAVKAAWIDMQGVPHPDRFYTRKAWLFNFDSSACEERQVGLAGLHIVSKTPGFPQWVWSTFEQVDNVPPRPQALVPSTFNKGDGTPMPKQNPVQCPPDATGRHKCPLPPPAPYNVDRLKPIFDTGGFSTAKTNATYQAMIAQKYPDSPWRYYELVMTQWPRNDNRPDLDGSPANTFPGTGVDATAFANTTMEPFQQTNVETGCMSCHNLMRPETDFVWTLKTRAYPRDKSNYLNVLLKIESLLGDKEP